MGVAGVLVAATAIAFIFAGTLLSFHAWPQLTGAADTRPLIVATGVAKPRVVARIVAGPAGAGAPKRRVPAGGTVPTPSAPVSTGRPPTPTLPFAANDGSAAKPAPKPSTPSTPAPHTGPPSERKQNDPAQQLQQTVQQTQQTLQQATQQTTNALASTAAATTAALGNTVAGVTSAAGNSHVVNVLSPAVGQTVSGLGAAVGATLTGVGKLVAGLLTPQR